MKGHTWMLEMIMNVKWLVEMMLCVSIRLGTAARLDVAWFNWMRGIKRKRDSDADILSIENFFFPNLLHLQPINTFCATNKRFFSLIWTMIQGEKLWRWPMKWNEIDNSFFEYNSNETMKYYDITIKTYTDRIKIK